MTPLLQRLTLAESSAEEERLLLLVAAWREQRSPELADCIEAQSADLDRRRPRIAGKTNEARLATWLDLERNRDDLLTGWLLASPRLEDTLTAPYRKRIVRIATWKPDPRLASPRRCSRCSPTERRSTSRPSSGIPSSGSSSAAPMSAPCPR